MADFFINIPVNDAIPSGGGTLTGPLILDSPTAQIEFADYATEAIKIDLDAEATWKMQANHLGDLTASLEFYAPVSGSTYNAALVDASGHVALGLQGNGVLVLGNTSAQVASRKLLLSASAPYLATSSNEAILQVNSTTQGVLFPRMTTAQKTALSTEGLVVYDNDLHNLSYRTDTAWRAPAAINAANTGVVSEGVTVHTMSDGETYTTPANVKTVILSGSVATITVLMPGTPVIGQDCVITIIGSVGTLTLTPTAGSSFPVAAPASLASGNSITYTYLELGATHYWVQTNKNF